LPIRFRYFVDRGGPFAQRVASVLEQRRAARDSLVAFMKEVGASQIYGEKPPYLIDAEHPNALDQETWAKTKPRRGEFYFRPRKNTEAGRAMSERMKALPECPAIGNAVEAVPGLHKFMFAAVREDGRCFDPSVFYFDAAQSCAVIKVPWRDYPEAELRAYESDRKAGKRFSGELDFALWKAPEWLQEIKEWEAMKLREEQAAGESP
jgi:hypothetical protein